MSASDVLEQFKRFPNGFLQERYEYDANDNILYAGFAPRGLATSAGGWFIKKFTTTGSNVTLAQWAEPNKAWDDRATETYA